MKKNMLALTLALVALGVVQTASAAVTYEFHQVSHSDIDENAPAELVGRATIDGDRSRVDFLSGDAYPPGTYVVSTNGSRTLVFVDPTRKSYTEFNTANVAAVIGSKKIDITNLASNVENLDDHPMIAGTPTNHYRLTISYDMTITFGAMPLKQSVRTVIEKWTTVAFGDVNETFLASSAIRTGNAKIDEMIDLEATKIKGFPLKQTVQVLTTTDHAPTPGSKLTLSPTRSSRREMTITAIQDNPVDGSLFSVPVTFRKTDPSRPDERQTQVQVLSLEPAGKP
jgi:hypothetical protein